MVYILIFFLELFILFISSYFLFQVLAKAIFKLIRNEKITIHLLFYIFLPGIIIHELAHALCAGMLFVRVGEMSFYPEITEQGVRFGSVEVGKTDFFRRMIIGVAPVFLGLLIISGILFLTLRQSSVISININEISIGIKILLFYLIFAISNTMFSSKKDLEGGLEFLLFLLIILTVGFFAGGRIDLSIVNGASTLFKQLIMFLAFPLVINASLILIIKIIGGIRKK